MEYSHLMVCVSGFSGTGKDEVAKFLVEKFGAIHTGLADPAKRHMADLYGWTRDQLFGPSHFRNTGDARYPKQSFFTYDLGKCDIWEHTDDLENWDKGNVDKNKIWSYIEPGTTSLRFVKEGDPRFWLSPREALQKYCEKMNDLYEQTWIRKGIEIHKQLADVVRFENNECEGYWYFKYQYDRMEGIKYSPNANKFFPSNHPCITCFSDFRHIHEFKAADEAQDHKTRVLFVRVKRPGIENPPYDHRSETEQTKIPDSKFHVVIDNNGTIEDLHAKLYEMMQTHG